jgi:hypothetical protein
MIKKLVRITVSDKCASLKEVLSILIIINRLINSDSTVTQLWSPITLRNPKMKVMFSEMSVLTKATRYKVPEDVYHLERAVQYPAIFYNGVYLYNKLMTAWME